MAGTDSNEAKIFEPSARHSPSALEIILLIAALAMIIISLSGMFGFISW